MEILFAIYGADGDFYDVTSRIKQGVQNGELKDKIYSTKNLGNPTMKGGKGRPKLLKELTIYYNENCYIKKLVVGEKVAGGPMPVNILRPPLSL